MNQRMNLLAIAATCTPGKYLIDLTAAEDSEISPMP
jgi:hypothetical protein